MERTFIIRSPTHDGRGCSRGFYLAGRRICRSRSGGWLGAQEMAGPPGPVSQLAGFDRFSSGDGPAPSPVRFSSVQPGALKECTIPAAATLGARSVPPRARPGIGTVRAGRKVGGSAANPRRTSCSVLERAQFSRSLSSEGRYRPRLLGLAARPEPCKN